MNLYVRDRRTINGYKYVSKREVWEFSIYLFTVLQLDKHTIIILGGNTLGEAAGCLNKHLQGAHEELPRKASS